MLVHENNHPHVLLLEGKDGQLSLPGGRLRPGEGEVEGLKRKLQNKLGATEEKVREMTHLYIYII